MEPHTAGLRLGWRKPEHPRKSHLAGDTEKATQLHREKQQRELTPAPWSPSPQIEQGKSSSTTPDWSHLSWGPSQPLG